MIELSPAVPLGGNEPAADVVPKTLNPESGCLIRQLGSITQMLRCAVLTSYVRANNATFNGENS